MKTETGKAILLETEKATLLLRQTLSKLELSNKLSEKKALELMEKLCEIDLIIARGNHD